MITQTSTSPEFLFKPRHYLHFDLPLSQKSACELVRSRDAVARHAFLPFIGYEQVTHRIRRDETGKLVKKNKTRPIRFAAHRDAAIYSYYAQRLEPLYEAKLSELKLGSCVTAFRGGLGGKTNIHFAAEVFDFIDRHRPCVALSFDLSEFFDRLDHGLLKDQWRKLLGEQRLPADHFKVFKSLTDFCWVEQQSVYAKFGVSRHNPKAKGRRRLCSAEEFRQEVRGGGLLNSNPTPGRGIPQGSPLSALLANLYMLDFDQAMAEAAEKVGGLYRRYCDDIMIVAPSGKEDSLTSALADACEQSKLSLNTGKSHRVIFPEGSGKAAHPPEKSLGNKAELQYLGFLYDGNRALIRPSSVGRYYQKMRRGVRLAKLTQLKYNRLEWQREQEASPLKTRKLNAQYSYLIGRHFRPRQRKEHAHKNFLTYAYKAARVLRSPDIKRQVRRHWTKLQKEIHKPL